jgi:hypothetical protein
VSDLLFTREYLDHQKLTAQLHAWAEEHPSLVRVESIARTGEGRDVWLLTLGPDPDRARPTVWIDGNMHAGEVCGSSVALAIAHDVLRIHLGQTVHGLPPHLLEVIREVRFMILPRMSPDGAEAVLKTGRWVRSVPRDKRLDRQRARWIAGDLDGDGLSLVMRQEDPTGELVESKVVPGLMVPRRIEDPGPYYKLYPEGSIEAFDGSNIPSPGIHSDNDPDLNRNFPYSWAPEPDQIGAGGFPGSEPESRAVIEVATRNPAIFAWLNLHTFGGVFIRPLGDKPDSKMDQEDLAIFRQLGAWGDELTKYPTVSGFEDFLYEPDKPIRGDLTDFAYHQRGAIALACELWDLYQQLGFPRRKPFVDQYTHLLREDLEKIGRWDAEHNRGRVIRPWKKFRHPQIGEVEVGGLDPRIGIWNPPPERLAEVCTNISAYTLRLAALAPRLVVSTELEAISSDLTAIEVTIENRGYLSTQILHSAKSLAFNEPIHLAARPEGCELVVEADTLRELGHLEGWGHGLYDGTGALHFARSKGSMGRKRTRVVVRGHGRVVVRAGSCRVGWVERTVDI